MFLQEIFKIWNRVKLKNNYYGLFKYMNLISGGYQGSPGDRVHNLFSFYILLIKKKRVDDRN